MADLSGISNAKITETFLGYEDHHIFTFMIDLEHERGCQGFGNWALDQWDKESNKRIIPDGRSMQWIVNIIDAVGVNSWEELKGQLCRIRWDSNERIVAIGHIIQDKWFTWPPNNN